MNKRMKQSNEIFLTFKKKNSIMIRVNSCEIVNQIDNKCFTLYVEWLNSHFKVILLEPTMSPLSGEVCIRPV